MRLITKVLFSWLAFELLSISPVMAKPPTLIKVMNRIINQSSGYCLDDGTAKNGGEVRMWECAAHPNQVWVVFESEIENNFFFLKNQTSNFCLDTDGSKKNGGTARVWECANHPNQLWEVHTLPSGRYRFKNKASGFCLDTDGKAVNGGNVHMWECADHPNQSWFGTLPLASAEMADQLINHSSGYCLDDGTAKNGGEVRMWECAAHPNQVWTVERATSSIFRLRNQASNFCLDTDGSKKNGGTARVWECANHPNQLWEVHTLPSGRYRFKNKASGFCLDTDGKAVNGGNVHMWECADHPNQSWFGNSKVINSVKVICVSGDGVNITGEIKNYSNLSVTYNNKFIGLDKVGKCLKYDGSSPRCLQWAPPEPEVTIGDPVSVPAKGSAIFEIGPLHTYYGPDSKLEIQRSSVTPLSLQLSWWMDCIR